MLTIEEPQTSILILAARILIASVFLVSGIHKGIWYGKAVAEFRNAGIPAIGLVLPATIILHLAAPIFLILGYMTREAALALAVFTVIATLKVHSYWRLPKEEQLARSRITAANLAIIGGLLLLAAAGPGQIALSP